MNLADIQRTQAQRDWERRFWSKVTKTETCWLWTASKNSAGYGVLGIGGRSGKMHLAHRLSYELAYGEIPAGKLVDHICRTRNCVNPAHLRPVSKKQNNENRAGPQSNSSSGYLGVHRSKRGRWRAHAQHNGRLHYAGDFDTPEEANAAAIALRNKLFTHNDLDRLAVGGE